VSATFGTSGAFVIYLFYVIILSKVINATVSPRLTAKARGGIWGELMRGGDRRSLETNLDLAGSVLIFDEAHNLDSLCSDASSINLRATDLANAVREVETILRMIGVDGGGMDAQCSV
jgi:hypothetical protein